MIIFSQTIIVISFLRAVLGLPTGICLGTDTDTILEEMTQTTPSFMTHRGEGVAPVRLDVVTLSVSPWVTCPPYHLTNHLHWHTHCPALLFINPSIHPPCLACPSDRLSAYPIRSCTTYKPELVDAARCFVLSCPSAFESELLLLCFCRAVSLTSSNVVLFFCSANSCSSNIGLIILNNTT